MKYVTSKIPIVFVHGFVALKFGGGDQKQVLQSSTEDVFVCLIVALCGNADDF